LTPYLQREFRRQCPPGWECEVEARLLTDEVTSLLGYDPRADVVLTNPVENARVWIEFEVSRADPVANHAKFATAHLFTPQCPADHFVAMLSAHIDRGRRNLACATIRLMRQIGMSAFQTTLLPLRTPTEVKRLNQLTAEELTIEKLDIAAEVERVFAVITPVGQWGRLNVHLAGDLLDVFTNIRGWNVDLSTADGQKAWGRRACTYFACDPATKLFAPSKFCAYMPVHPAGSGAEPSSRWHRMSATAYAELNDGTHVMDGQRAWRHLVSGLGMRIIAPVEASQLADNFSSWLASRQHAIVVRGGEPTFLLPPTWYTAK